MHRVELPLEVEEFLVWLASERGRSRNTIQAYRRDLQRYGSWLTDRRLTVLTVGHEDLTEFVAGRRESFPTVVAARVHSEVSRRTIPGWTGVLHSS